MENPPKELTIANMVQLPRLKVFDAELTSYEETHEYENKYPIVDRNTYLGIEVEVENIQFYNQTSPYWRMIEDGSLRNNGREFITPPIRARRVEHALNDLFEQDLNKSIDFSERTSIHIHMNIRTLTIKQLEALILTYLVFEKVLFNFSGPERYTNIFCVPLVETDVGEDLLELIQNKNPAVAWQKYTALNLLPIMQKGTIEFRHLGGTKDIKKIITWINMILCLKKFALQKSPEYIWNRIKTLNTTSEYRLFGEEVFKELIQLLWDVDFNSNVSDCVTYVKQFCIPNPFSTELRLKYIQVENRMTTYQEVFLDDLLEEPVSNRGRIQGIPVEMRNNQPPPPPTMAPEQEEFIRRTPAEIAAFSRGVSIPTSIQQMADLWQTGRTPFEENMRQIEEETLLQIRAQQLGVR